MGTLKPGASYVYERNGSTVYAREIGSDPSTRKEIGWEYDPVSGHAYDPRTHDGRPLHEHLQEDKLWGEIRRMARTNPTLQEALERAKILYYLSKENGNS